MPTAQEFFCDGYDLNDVPPKYRQPVEDGVKGRITPPREMLHRVRRTPTGKFAGKLLYRATPTTGLGSVYCEFRSSTRKTAADDQVQTLEDWDIRGGQVDRGTIDTAVSLTEAERAAQLIGARLRLKLICGLTGKRRATELRNFLRTLDRNMVGPINNETTEMALDALCDHFKVSRTPDSTVDDTYTRCASRSVRSAATRQLTCSTAWRWH